MNDKEAATNLEAAWSARCDCNNNHNSASGRCNTRNVTDPTRFHADGFAICERCRAFCLGEGFRGWYRGKSAQLTGDKIMTDEHPWFRQYYVSYCDNQWRIIHNSLPICNDKPTYEEVLRVAMQFGLELHADYYDGNTNSWKPRDIL